MIEIALDERDDGVVSGHVFGTRERTTIAIHLTRATEFRTVIDEVRRVTTVDGSFTMRGPDCPASWEGTLITTSWHLTAETVTGAVVEMPLHTGGGRSIIESPGNDDLDSPVPGAPWARLGLAAATTLLATTLAVVSFAQSHLVRSGVTAAVALAAGAATAWTARTIAERRTYGIVRCRVEPTGEGLHCIVRSHRSEPLRDATVIARLVVAEMISRPRVDRPDLRLEHLVVDRSFRLREVGDGLWEGTIALPSERDAPPSWYRRDPDHRTAGVSWVVVCTLRMPDAHERRRVLPLAVVLEGQGAACRPERIETPEAAHRATTA